jgi:hypothetical protein
MLGGALQGYVSVPVLGYIPPHCVYFSLIYMDNMSRHPLLTSQSLRYTTFLNTGTMVPLCWLNGQLFAKQINKSILQKSSLIDYISIHSLNVQYAYKVSSLMFICRKCKTSGCVREELDLEAKGRDAETVVFYFSRRSATKRLVPCKLSSKQRKTHSRICGIS